MEKLFSCIDKFNTWVGKGVSFLPLLVSFAICYEILCRDILKDPTLWVGEGTVFACAVLYLLGGAWTLLNDGHVRVDIIYSRFSPRNRALLECFIYIPFAIYILVLLWATTGYTLRSIGLQETTMSAWDPPLYPIKIAMWLSLLMIWLQGTVRFLRNLRFYISGHTKVEEQEAETTASAI